MDHADRAQEGIDNALADALADHHRNNPRALDHAAPAPLLRGGEVIFRDCDEAIDPRRLAAHPAAIRCIDCQEDFERSPRL